jgi:hypothetical protein
VTGGAAHLVFSPYPYLFIIFSFLGLLIYQSGLQRARISVVGSISDVVASTYIVAVGTVVFGEHLPSDPITLAARLAGFAGVLLGTVVVAISGGNQHEPGTREATLRATSNACSDRDSLTETGRP